MPFATIWTTTAKDVIRDIIISDINGDNKPEVVYASWDSNIYAVRGNDGGRVWIFKNGAFDGPAEKLASLKISADNIKHVVASRHKYLIVINGEDGKAEWGENLNSWITKVRTGDFDCDGRDEIAALTRKREMYVIDDDGEILYKKTLKDNKTLYHVTLCNIESCDCPSVLVGGSQLEVIFHHGENLLDAMRLEKPILSMGCGRVFDDLGYGTIIGLNNEIIVLRDRKSRIHFRRDNFKPLIIRVGDVDGDLQDELIIGDWATDSIIILKIQKNSLKVLSEIKLDSNPLHFEIGDIDGDGCDEILVILDKNENNFVIIRKNNILFLADSYNASSGIMIGEALGYGYGDIVYRSGRERVSLLIHVPRLSAPKIVKEKTTFNIGLISQANDKLSMSPLLSAETKKLKSQRAKLSVGWVTMSSQIIHAKRYGRAWLKVQRKNRTMIRKNMLIASNALLSPSMNAISTLDEDFLSISREIPSNASITVSGNYLTMGKERIDAGNIAHIASSKLGFFRAQIYVKYGKRKTTLKPIFLVDKALNIRLQKKDYYLPNDKIDLRIRNMSKVKLKVLILGDTTISVPETSIELPPTSEIKIAVGIRAEIDKFMDKIRGSLKIVYEGLKKHCIPVPLDFNIVNARKIRKIATEMHKLKKSRQEIIATISEMAKIPKEIIAEILR